MILSRRRNMMIDSINNENENWDLEWDYTMGDPLENGFSKQTGKYNPTMTQDGLYFDCVGSDLYGIYPTDYPNCTDGIYEMEAKIIVNNAILGQGLRLQLTNDNSSRGGVSFFVNQNNKMFYFDTSGYTQIGICNYNEWLKFRIEIINNIGYVYLNNQQIYSSNKFTTMNMTFHNRFIVQGTIECYVRSIKIKKIS